MAKTASTQASLFAGAPFAFADRFLQDHAGQIISEPRTAILELIANAYDAGATKIDIVWPAEKGQEFSVTDAMLPSVLPIPTRLTRRRTVTASVTELDSQHPAQFPFRSSFLMNRRRRARHEGSAVLEKHLLAVEELRQLIGSKFIVDPSLCIRVNQQPVELMSLEGLKTTEIPIQGHGIITVHFIDSIEHYRSAKLRGISWWVNQRRVGEPNWDRLDEEGAYLDGRTEHAKKFSFIVMADFLTPGQDVKADWSDFHANQRTNAVREAVHRCVIKEIQAQLATSRKERKKAAIENCRELMGELPTFSKRTIGQFIDEVQEKCPTKSDRDLSRTVQVLAKLEQNRSGYDLLAQLFDDVVPKPRIPSGNGSTSDAADMTIQTEGVQ